LVDYMTWIRAVLALTCGVWISIQSTTSLAAVSTRAGGGAANLIFAFNIVCFTPLPVAYTITYLRVDKESHGAKLLFAGVPQGIAVVLLIWIWVYTSSHEADEMVFAAALGKGDIDGNDTPTDGSSSAETTDTIQCTAPDESEFLDMTQ
jgi:hypothetical protein